MAMSRFTRMLSAALVGGIAIAAQPAAALDLFKPAPGAARAPVAAPSSKVLEERLVTVNPTAITAILNARKLAPNASTEPLRVPLFDGKSVRFKRSSTSAVTARTTLWSGDNVVAGGGFAELAVKNGQVTGAMEVAGALYHVEPVGNGGLHRLTKVAANKYRGALATDPRRMTAGPARKSGQLERAVITSAGIVKPQIGDGATSNTVITILGVYSSIGAQILRNPEEKIARDIGLINRALKNSGVPVTVKIAGFVHADGFEDDGEPLESIFTAEDDWAVDIRTARNKLKADLVVFYVGKHLVDDKELCGYGQGNTTINPRFVYSAVNSECAGTVAVSGTIGFTMGLKNDRWTEQQQNPTYKLSKNDTYYGYVSLPGRFYDALSWPTKCEEFGYTDCQPVWYYSNPRMRLKGYRLGIAKGQSGAADAAKVITTNRKAIAAFR